MKPNKSILDPSFRYTCSVQTDVAKTFARIRRERKQAAAAEQQAEIEAREKVRSLVWRGR